MTRSDRQCVLFFHGNDGLAEPHAMGGLRADTLVEALTVLHEQIRLPAHAELAGVWCCSFAEVAEGKPAHPSCCQYRFSLAADGKMSNAVMVQ